MSLTATTFCAGVRDGSLDPKHVYATYTKTIQDDATNSYVGSVFDYSHDRIDALAKKPLASLPVAIKDIFHVSGKPMTCGSRMLESYVSPYTATAVQKLLDAGALVLGKTNMDEFAMGTTGETSAWGPVLNPYDMTRIAGGSSSGSAAAVAQDLCVAALGTDTGGSIRLPASLCGVVGIKPTYGRISRYGVQAMASSFDHVGVFSKTVRDGALLTQTMSGQDSYDATTQPESNNTDGWESALDTTSLSGMRFAVPHQFFGAGLDQDCEASIKDTIEVVKQLGGTVEMIDLPEIEYGVSIYYILVPAEISTNLARFDGIRFGHQADTKAFDTIYDYYAKVRDQGFGEEVKRRILTGTYVLSAGYQDAYYKKALQARQAITNKITSLMREYDAIIGPTSTGPAWKLGAFQDDPVGLYMLDKYTVLANITHMPAMSLPVGYVQRDGVNLPVGFQIMTKKRDEKTMFAIASAIEKVVSFSPLHSLV